MATFWNRIKGLFGAGEVAEVSAGGLLAGVLQGSTAPRRGTKELLDSYRTSPWVHAVVHRIAFEAASVPFMICSAPAPGSMPMKALRRAYPGRSSAALVRAADMPDGAMPLPTHPLAALLDDPCPAFTRHTWRWLLQAFLDTKGEVPIVIERDAQGLPVELWPTPPHWLAEVPHRSYPFFRFSFGSWQRTIAEDDVLFLRHPELVQPYGRGAGVGESISDEIDIDEFASKHLRSWFFNRALPDAFVSVEGVSSEKEARLYEEKLKQKHGGKDRAFQIHVTNGKVSVQQLGYSFKDQMVPQVRQTQRDTALQVYGVPPEIMGIVENSNRATIDAAYAHFGRGVLVPRLDFLADAFTQWGRREFADSSLSVHYENPVGEDREFTLSVMQAQPTAFSKNEWRALARAPAVEGWDDEFPSAAPAFPPMPGADAPALQEGDDPADPNDAGEGDETDDPNADDAKKSAGRFLRGLRSLPVRG